jgi:steroid delta-isomerase-like uncharacterized protein/uncharacterized protein (TIGR02246 family)
MAEMQKQALQTIGDSLNAGDAKKFASAYAEDGVSMVAGLPEAKGREAIAGTVQQFFDAFSNRKFAWTRIWTKGDVMVTEWAWNATNTGDFMGNKATNKPAGNTGLSVVWINADGAVKAEHRYENFPTVMGQLGLSKEKARPIPTLPAQPEWITSKPDEDKNLDVAKQIYAALDAHSEKDMLGAAADDITFDDMTLPAPVKGKEENKKFLQGFFKAFPDLKQTTSNAWAIGDYVINEGTMSGTNKGAFMGMPATKKSMNQHFVDVLQFKDGKLSRGWSYGNGMEVAMQLGLMKPPGAKPAAPAAPAKPGGTPAPTTPAKPPAKK